MPCVTGSSGDGRQTDLGKLELGVVRFQEEEVSHPNSVLTESVGLWRMSQTIWLEFVLPGL